jgi:tetratricopeptide (TPR) repeat protein
LTIGRRLNNLPGIAASRKRGVLEVSDIWRIDNRPQAASLPHNAGEPQNRRSAQRNNNVVVQMCWSALLLALWLVSSAWGQSVPAVEQVLRHAIELHQAGNVTAAIPEYRAYLKQVPNNVMARSNLGAALSKAGLYEEAILEYKKALELQPGNPAVRLNLALAYYKAADITHAASELGRVVAEQPSNRQAIFLLADCDLRLGENQKVIALLSPLEQQSPDDKALIYLLGTALIRDGQPARGQVLVDRILRDGDSAEARLLMGATKINVQDFAGALQDLKKAVELNPQLPDVYSYYGMALASTGDTPGAGVAFRKELESNPNDYTSNMQLGILLKQDEKYAEARHCFERALGVRPGDPSVRYQLATLDLQENRTKEALTQLQKLTEEVPTFVAAHVSLATAYYRLHQKEEGDAERAIVLRLNAEKQSAEPGVKSK